jgi:hypothetical protein
MNQEHNRAARDVRECHVRHLETFTVVAFVNIGPCKRASLE